ncbi:MAG: 2,3-bisphosphoglycerate-independent phosphoglycerate mutase [Gemmatimonadota bacterium]
MELSDLAAIVQPGRRKILLFVLDGLGGLPMEPGGPTELEAARTPNMDDLARRGGCGLHIPVSTGVTPGSGPGHLALFGYDPLRYRVGRGVLAALGIGFDLRPGDIAARGNFCTVDGEGRIVDRRAGRISSEDAAPLAERLDQIRVKGAETFVRHVKEHRFLIVIRPARASGAEVSDTDPGRTGVIPAEPVALSDAAGLTADMVRAWLAAAREALADQAAANMVLLRGFSSRPGWPRFGDVFGLRPFAAAAYPMYRGVARLVGMEAMEAGEEPEDLVAALLEHREGHDFFFLHYKATDKAGEDGDFDRKVACIEAADSVVPDLLEAGADVVLITGDHSTPACSRGHSWHPVPFLLFGGEGRAETAMNFGETACRLGSLGMVRGCDLMPLAVARAGRLAKFGA